MGLSKGKRPDLPQLAGRCLDSPWMLAEEAEPPWWAELVAWEGRPLQVFRFLSPSQNITCHLGNTSAVCGRAGATMGRQGGGEVPDMTGTSSFLPFLPTDL